MCLVPSKKKGIMGGKTCLEELKDEKDQQKVVT